MAIISTPDGKTTQRDTCMSCAACELAPGGHPICRRNPPGRGPTGVPLWPNVDPEKDWCMQWISR